MARASLQAWVVGLVVVLGGAWAALLVHRGARGERELGFWFEPVSYAATPLGGPLTPQDFSAIDRYARAEIIRAFAGLPVVVSDRRDARYRVRVVAGVADPRFRHEMEVAGESRAISGLGGFGTVGFGMIAGHAVGFAPPGTTRDAMVRAIGVGIGRTAVHEFTHQFLPTSQIHGDDASSYEYGSAARWQQYYGELHWDIARPLLERRLGVSP